MEQRERYQSQKIGRRQWFVGTMRCTLLGGLALLSGHLVLKSRRPECRQNATCQQCGVWGTCGLPQAIEMRRKDRG